MCIPAVGQSTLGPEVKDVVVETSKVAKVGALSAAETVQLTSEVAT